MKWIIARWPVIIPENTDFETITLLYKGPLSARMVLSSKQRHSILYKFVVNNKGLFFVSCWGHMG